MQDESKPLINRVAESGIITLNLEDFYPKNETLVFDLKDYLFRGLILREKDFREALAAIDWAQFAGKNVALYCSTDAIIPLWAYQLVAVNIAPYASLLVCGKPEELLLLHYMQSLGKLDLQQFADKRVVVKGCGEKPVPAAAYTEIARLLQPVVKSLMYGEPCSTVPLYKRKP
jgi:hypothetical protein